MIKNSFVSPGWLMTQAMKLVLLYDFYFDIRGKLLKYDSIHDFLL